MNPLQKLYHFEVIFAEQTVKQIFTQANSLIQAKVATLHAIDGKKRIAKLHYVV